MGLNPSCNSVKGEAFPVLGDPPFSLERAEVAKAEILAVLPEAQLSEEMGTRQVYKEGSQGYQMARAGIHMYYEGQEDDIEEIQVVSVTAEALGWTFRRAWYYWVCKTRQNPIPEARAVVLNEKWGTKVRYNGYAGGTDVRGPGDSYHVDTVDGLQALVAAIKGGG